MQIKLFILVLGIFLISFISAETIIAGNCLLVNLSELESLDNVIYDVVGNESDLEGLIIELNGTIANICTVPNYKPDSFTIIFIDNSTKEIVKEVHHYSSSSGGTRKVYIENKTITEVDNYIDNTIYLNNETEIDILNKKINELEKDLKNKKTLNDISRILIAVLSVLLIIIVFCMIKKDEK